MNPLYMLNTNIISDIFKLFPNQNVFSKLEEYEKLYAISTTTFNEMLFGVQKMAEGKKNDYIFSKLIDDIQANYPIIQYDNHAA